MAESERGKGTCAKCGGEAVYVRTVRGYLWVHADTGKWTAKDPETGEIHDVNTYVEIPRGKEVPA